MHRISRASLLIAAAVILPLLILFATQFGFQARDQRAQVETAALNATERVLVEVDGALQRTLGALDMLASARSVTDRDWPTLYERLRQFRRTQPDWITVRLTDLGTGRVMFDLRQPLGTPIRPGRFDPPDRATWPARAFVGDVGGDGPGCPCALVYRYIAPAGQPPLLAVVAIDTRPFLRILAAQARQGRVGGLVDRHGNFVARTLDHRRRVGTPATAFVQRAVRARGSGIYQGTTWEGFESYTAYRTSDLSGWSAHIAFSPGLIDSPRWRSLVAELLAGFATLLLAVTLVWYVLRQLAEARRVQERMQESQKLEALGQITGGIAHDFNNLLTPIVGGLGVLSRDPDLNSRSRRMVESALSASRRAAKLTGQLLAFSRRQKMEIAPVDLEALFAEIRPLLAQSAGPDIGIRIDAGADARCVATDRNQLELALLNLVLNARDAMPEGGSVTITTRLEPAVRRQPPMVVLEVRDTGAGMQRHVLRRATEPFFTTKRVGSGTGLGLAQVYGIVRQSGGTLTIDSAPGRGTAVTLSLPACELPPSVPVEAEAQPIDVAANGGRILLCDDDDEVRIFVARVLEDAGHEVESVSDGRAAIQRVRSAEVDLLVVDFAMQGMNGADVTAAARAFRPDLPVLMITGYADTEAVATQAPGIPVLRKPFEIEALIAAVRDALDAGSNTGQTG